MAEAWTWSVLCSNHSVVVLVETCERPFWQGGNPWLQGRQRNGACTAVYRVHVGFIPLAERRIQSWSALLVLADCSALRVLQRGPGGAEHGRLPGQIADPGLQRGRRHRRVLARLAPRQLGQRQQKVRTPPACRACARYIVSSAGDSALQSEICCKAGSDCGRKAAEGDGWWSVIGRAVPSDLLCLWRCLPTAGL